MSTLPSPTATDGPSRRYIADFEPSQRISGTFAISNAQMGRTRSDKPYLRCLLSDKTGELPARMWTIDEAVFRRLPTDGVVAIEGETQAYQGELQIILHSIEPTQATPDELRELLPTSARDVGEMFTEVVAILSTLQHPGIRALADAYLADEWLMDAFRRCPAAKSMHHAWLGGLLEHTLALLRLADAVCALYPRLSRDLVIMGLFIHDLGKTRELIYDRTFSYSDRGELVGHIVEGAHILRDKALSVMREKGVRFPAGAITVLEHIILSHHGVPEYGAAKVPSTPEAIVVSILDNLDAKIAIALSAARPERARPIDLGGNFTDRLWALDTKLYRPDPLAHT